MPICPVCNSSSPYLKYKLTFDIYHCKNCGLQFCTDAKFVKNFSSDLNENFREKALKPLRNQNFQKVITLLKKHISNNHTGLEVGCGHGWFLESCAKNNLKCEGIEPESRFNEYYLSHRLIVTNGFYPQDISKNCKYDFIVFNDVFEHIPAIDQIMKHNNTFLNANGVLVINLPVQEGLIYSFSKIAYFFAIKTLLNRMWQFNFHSPHLYYFTYKNLIHFASINKFQLVDVCKLKTINLSEISNRIKQDKGIGFVKYIVSFIGILCIYPFLQLLPDTICFVFRKKEGL